MWLIKFQSFSPFDPSANNQQRDEVTQPSVTSALATMAESAQQLPEHTPARSQTADSGLGSSQGNAEDTGPEVVDPLAHMSDSDKYGLKGFLYLMHNFPDYAALVTGQDVTQLGFDLTSTE